MSNGVVSGALVVDTELNNSGLQQDARAFRGMLRRMQQTVSHVGQNMARAGEGYLRSVSRQQAASRELNAELKAVQQRAVQLNKEMDAMRRSGIDDGNRERFNRLKDEFNETVSALNELHRAGKETKGVEQGFSRISDSAQRAAPAIARLSGSGALSFLRRLASGAKNAAIQLATLSGRALGTITRTLAKLGTSAGKAAGRLMRLGRSGKQSGQGLQFSLKNLLRYGLGIRSLFVLFNRLRSAIKEGFEQLSQYDPRVKASLASLSASLSGLKLSLSTAFAPIVTAVTPALVAFINLVTRAVNAVGMFMAALTGQSYYTAAKGVSQVGDAAGSASGNVKELKRQLAGFDKLNILKADSGSGGGKSKAAQDVADMFSKVPIDTGIADFVDRLKDMAAKGDWESVGRTIAGGVNGAVAKLDQWISWDNIGPTVTRAVDAFTGAFNGLVDGLDWTGIGNTFADGFNSLVYTVQRLVANMDLASLGQGIADGLNGAVARADFGALGDTLARVLTAKLVVVGNALARFDWDQFGPKLAEGFNSFIKRLDEQLSGIDWPGMARKMASGLNKFISHIDWRQLGDTFANRAAALIGAMKEALTTIKWGDTATKFATVLNAFFRRKDLFTAAGDTINAAIKGLLDFTKSFVITFDATTAGERIREALGRIKWGDIASDLWTTAKAAFAKAGDFVSALLGQSSTNKVVKNASDIYSKVVVKDNSTVAERIGKGLSDAFIAAIEWLKGQIADLDWHGIGEEINKALKKIDWAGIRSSLEDLIRELLSGLGDFAVGVILGDKAFQDNFILDFLEFFSPGIKDSLKKLEELYGGDYPKTKKAIEELANGPTTEIKETGKGKTNTATPVVVENDDKNPVVTDGGEDGARTYRQLEVIDKAVQAIVERGGRVQDKSQLYGGQAEKKLEDMYTFGDFLAGHGIAEESTDAVSKLFQWLDENEGKSGITGSIARGLNNAMVKNAEAVRGNTDAQDNWKTKIQGALENGLNWKQTTARKEWEKSGGGWGDVMFGGDQSVDVAVNYRPNVSGGERYTNNLAGYLKALFAPGTDTETRVALVKNGWRTLVDYVGTNKTLSAVLGLVKLGWDTLSAFVGTNNPLSALVKLAKSGWSTIQTFVGTNNPLSALIRLAKSGWSTIQAFVGTNTPLSALVNLVRNAWQTVSSWASGFKGTNLMQLVGLAKSAWQTVSSWVDGSRGSRTVSQAVDLTRAGWTWLNTWAESYRKGDASAYVSLMRSGWTWLNTWVETYKNGTASAYVGLVRAGWNWLSSWVQGYQGGSAEAYVGLSRNNWYSLGDWAQQFDYGSAWANVELWRDGWYSLASWAQQYDSGSAWALVDLERNGWNSIADWASGWATKITGYVDLVFNTANQVTATIKTLLGLASGGIIIGTQVRPFASGGVIAGGAARLLSNVPHYAGGTTRAHGTVFVAGESGPEVMGHINGRTEILNKSQIAQAIYSAVVAGMGQAVNALGRYLAGHMTTCTNALVATIGNAGGLVYHAPTMASGAVMPYDISAQIARSTADLQGTLDANNEDLIQTIISVIGAQTTAIVAALQAVERKAGGGAGGLSAQAIIDEINRRTQMFNASPLKI